MIDARCPISDAEIGGTVPWSEAEPKRDGLMSWKPKATKVRGDV